MYFIVKLITINSITGFICGSPSEESTDHSTLKPYGYDLGDLGNN